MFAFTNMTRVMVLLTLVLGFSSQAAQASGIFSNLGSDGSFAGDGFVLNGDRAFATFPHDLDIASSFAAQTSGVFEWVRLPISTFGPSIANLTLFADAGDRPGEVLETISLSNLPADTASPPLTTVFSSLHPLLQAGQTYWLGLDVSGETILRWNLNQLGDFDPISHRIDNGPWTTADSSPSGAFCINCTVVPLPPVPEPSAWLLLSSGLVLLRSASARGKKLVR